jgi:hypothetical protein
VSIACLITLGCGTERPPPVARRDVVLNDDLGSPVFDVPVDLVVDAGANDSTEVGADASDAMDPSVDVTSRDVPTRDTTIAADVEDVPRITDVRMADVGWVPITGGACGARERRVPVQKSPHVDVDAGPLLYITNPPASGPHYSEWARWGSWRDLARGYWVHNLEHGGVAFLYRCPGGTCDATRMMVERAAAMIPRDGACVPTDAAPASVRVVITNDEAIDTPIAGAAWGWLYAAECVDAESMRAFYTRHAGMAPEDFCDDGTRP